MAVKPEDQLTRCVEDAGVGTRAELAQMVGMLYDNIRRLTAAEMRQAFHQPLESLTVQPTAIANDAMMRVLQQRQAAKNPEQFFALAARFVHQLVIDYQRHRLAAKRGSGKRSVGIEAAKDVVDPDGLNDPDLPPVVRMLARLRDQYPRKAEVVSLHCLCDYSLPKVAQMLGISLATAERDWSFAKAWLSDEMNRSPNRSADRSPDGSPDRSAGKGRARS